MSATSLLLQISFPSILFGRLVWSPKSCTKKNYENVVILSDRCWLQWGNLVIDCEGYILADIMRSCVRERENLYNDVL